MGLSEDHEIVFTPGDIAARNILIREGRIAAIIDWEFAGWYPAYWEYVFALRGLDNVDWNTLGTQVPSLFEEKYDQQYLAVRFILSLS
ncbi:Putative Serine/threonine protein kinase [[Torrubiella] hemipterigena]|uniref:Putative Serine/threonine protein kinase n=1 Tax=[Torrubiella] hemipterigena TaxID=1531966 RepID=A0A0A1TNM9_9HYPO|nr:Putative Serine/threonine protein kinase [[Torrubiella] hemipterigena]